MTQCSKHVKFQLPNERSRVRHLLDSIMTTDDLLLDTIANLGSEDKGTFDYFEQAAAHLLMCDPVAKRKSVSGPPNRDNITHVSEETVSASSSVAGKV